VLITAVQNAVERERLGIAMATTSFFRGLGGAVGTAVLGAAFAARAGTSETSDHVPALGAAARADVIDGVQTVFVVAAPLAALALAALLALREVPLGTEVPSGPPARDDRAAADATPALASGRG
jgi:MFS family permease